MSSRGNLRAMTGEAVKARSGAVRILAGLLLLSAP